MIDTTSIPRNPNPSYVDLIVDAYEVIRNINKYEAKRTFFDVLCAFTFHDICTLVVIAVVFTIVRHYAEKYVFEPFTYFLNLDDKVRAKKMPESFWKTSVYLFLWLYCAYLITIKYDFFFRPMDIWDDWVEEMEIPFDIKVLYFTQCGFYIHSIYATIYMDAKRKDFWVLIFHHVLTLALISLSYLTRYHKIGIMVLFVHDITDILLEVTRINAYLKKRNNKFYPIHEYLSNLGFVAFFFSWILFRLYWFPLKIIYSAATIGIKATSMKGGGLFFLFNILLWILQILNIYWFYFIAVFLTKIATGQLSELADTREDEDIDRNTKKEK